MGGGRAQVKGYRRVASCWQALGRGQHSCRRTSAHSMKTTTCRAERRSVGGGAKKVMSSKRLPVAPSAFVENPNQQDDFQSLALGGKSFQMTNAGCEWEPLALAWRNRLTNRGLAPLWLSGTCPEVASSERAGQGRAPPLSRNIPRMVPVQRGASRGLSLRHPHPLPQCRHHWWKVGGKWVRRVCVRAPVAL